MKPPLNYFIPLRYQISQDFRIPKLSPLEEVEIRELLESKALYPIERQIIRMHYLNNFSFSEIAEAIGTSKSYAAAIEKKALKKLRRAV